MSFAINQYTVTPSAGVNGVISPSTPQTVDYGGSQVFIITPSVGYYIVDVSVNGSSVGAVSSYTFTNVQAAYTISATFAPFVAPSVTSTPSTLDQGQTSVLSNSSVVSTGASPYTYKWFVMAPGAGSYSLISGATSFSYSFVTSTSIATGNWGFILQVTDATGTAVNSTAVTVAVNAALVAPSVAPSIDVVVQGQTSNLTSTAVSTGTGPYTYQWMEMAPGGSSYSVITGATSNCCVLDTSALANGTWSFVVQVTDSTGATVNSTAVSIQVNSAPIPGPINLVGQTSLTSSAPIGISIAAVAVQTLATGSFPSLISGSIQTALGGTGLGGTVGGTGQAIVSKLKDILEKLKHVFKIKKGSTSHAGKGGTSHAGSSPPTGGVSVPTGVNITVHPHPNVLLTFGQVTQAGGANATPLTSYPPLPQGGSFIKGDCL